jgi:hypothetical protein
VNVQKISTKGIIALFIAILSFTAIISAQDNDKPNMTNNYLLCAGYIQSDKIDTSKKLVGANDEKEKNIYAQGDFVYFSAGSSSGVKVGDMFSVVRPRGKVNSAWSKKGNLGFFVQEVGAIEVIRVRNDVAVAQVKTSCDNMLMGDLVQPMPNRSGSETEQRADFDIFAPPSGKSTGSILMARDGHELLSSRQVVYIDLGAEDNVKVGDYLTIFRPLGTGSILDDLPGEMVGASNYGFESNEYRGGKFSNQAARKSGDEANGKVVISKVAKLDRPRNLRKIVGELVLINVKGKTATAVITRTSGEIHTGDNVEIQ